MKISRFTLIIGSLLLLIFIAVLVVFQVRQSEVAVVTTFGKPTRPITTPGAHLQLPWPIQRVYKFDQRVQNFENKLTEGITRDSFNLLTSVYVGWKINDPQAFFPKFAGSPEPIAEAERVLDRILGNTTMAIIGKHYLSDFVSANDTGTNFLGIEEEILSAVQNQVKANNYGLEVKFLGFKKLELPEQVTQAVFDRMQSERKVLADRSQYEGEAEAQRIRSDAERKAAELLADADSKSIAIRAQGEAEAAKSLAVFQQNPALANFIFKLNALEGSLKDKSVLIFDQNTPPFDLFRVSTNMLNK